MRPTRVEETAHGGYRWLAVPILRERRFVALFVVVCTVIAAIVAFLLPKEYTAKALVMPPSQNQSSMSSMLLGHLGSMAGIGAKDLGLKNATDLYVGILKSRTMSDALINQFHLGQVYGKNHLTDVRTKLKNRTDIVATKEQMISIAVTDRDPKRAAEMANAYVSELQKLSNTLAVTEATQRRVFYEQQLQQAKNQLADAEIALKQTQEKTGVLEINSQARAIIDAIAEIKAQIAAKEVKIQSMRSYVTEHNPELQAQEQQLAAFNTQLAKMESQQPQTAGDIDIPSQQIPTVGMEYIRRYRDVKYYETVYGLIAKQYELARMDEAKEAGLIQILDSAVTPDKKSWPPRLLIILLAMIAAFLVASGWVIARSASRGMAASDFGRALHEAWKGHDLAA
ncbi:MAG TPA: GNVR domain-containing protein [Candidatus Koribacter sp.]